MSYINYIAFPYLRHMFMFDLCALTCDYDLRYDFVGNMTIFVLRL